MSRRKLNAKGRSTGSDRFVMIPNWAFDSLAYRSLRAGPRGLLWELIRRFNGWNNGRITFSQREMARSLNVADRETVAAYVRELEAVGFIKATRRGGFNVKVGDRRATEWALTWQKIGDALPTKEFMHWQPSKSCGSDKPALKGGIDVPRST